MVPKKRAANVRLSVLPSRKMLQAVRLGNARQRRRQRRGPGVLSSKRIRHYRQRRSVLSWPLILWIQPRISGASGDWTDFD